MLQIVKTLGKIPLCRSGTGDWDFLLKIKLMILLAIVMVWGFRKWRALLSSLE